MYCVKKNIFLYVDKVANNNNNRWLLVQVMLLLICTLLFSMMRFVFVSSQLTPRTLPEHIALQLRILRPDFVFLDG